MSKLLNVAFCCSLALYFCLSSAAVSRNDNRGRYNPTYEEYYRNRELKNRNRQYYQNRQFDNYFRQYNPNVNDALARVVQQTSEANDDGRYSYSYETDNGIRSEERGVPVNIGTGRQSEVVEGSYSYISPEGLRVIVRYTADEFGFHPIITYEGVGAEKFRTFTQQPADVIVQ